MYSGPMISRDEALQALNTEYIRSGIVWAFKSACEQALEDFARGTGYKAPSAGLGRYELIADRLDRVFSCGDFEVQEGLESVGLDVLYEGLSEVSIASMPTIKAGLVIRNNLNGSNGWSLAGFRFITHSFTLGELTGIDWTSARKTLQAVSRQAPTSDSADRNLLDSLLSPEQRSDLAAQDSRPAVQIPTLVLAHALDRNTSESELAIGQSRYNDDEGRSWHWQEPLLGGPEPELVPRVNQENPTGPVLEPDAPVRLRPAASAEGAR